MYISSVNTWASRDSPLGQLVKELDLCLFLCVIQSLWDRDATEPIRNLSSHYNKHVFIFISRYPNAQVVSIPGSGNTGVKENTSSPHPPPLFPQEQFPRKASLILKLLTSLT